VAIPSYDFPHSIVDSTMQVKKGQPIELRGEVTRLDEDAGKVTVNLGPLVTVDIDKIRLTEKYRPKSRKKQLQDTVD
jgi:Cu/Ag efflux protein CusF